MDSDDNTAQIERFVCFDGVEREVMMFTLELSPNDGLLLRLRTLMLGRAYEKDPALFTDESQVGLRTVLLGLDECAAF